MADIKKTNRFIETQFTYHKIHSLKAYNLVALIYITTQLYNEEETEL